MPAIPLTFSQYGFTAAAKLVCFGVFGSLPASMTIEARSLKIEHVSPETLMQQEICRRTPLGQQAAKARQHGATVPDQTMLAILRKWFWARKLDAGFLLSGFPATLLHACVFDEWLDARGEALTGCVHFEPEIGAAPAATSPAVNPAVIEHYRTLGLLAGSSLSNFDLI
jgi:adenylate kinase